MRIASLFGQMTAALVFSISCALASESRPLAWAELVDPSAQIFEDPYRDLSYDQLENLREYAIETARIEEGGLDSDAQAVSESRIADAKELLADDGIDADWLIAQRWIVADRRKKAATAANPDLDGETVTLAGFAIAAPTENGTNFVYLVPERGMCSHMPPPNPNQMIRARLNSDWSPEMVHEPVRLTGKLSIEQTEHRFRVVDGEVPMHASFVLDVTQVETMQDMQAEAPQTNEWAASIAERLRASGQLPSQSKGKAD